MANEHHRTPMDRPNIVLVTADSVRADHCGFLSPDIDTTPTLDTLAEDGLVFENTIAPGPRTPSSMPVLWTGEHIGRENKGVYASRNEKKKRWQERRRRIKHHVTRFDTIAQRLSRKGYDAGAVTANPWTTTDTGFTQGFAHFVKVDGFPSDDTTPTGKRLLSKSSVLPGVPDVSQWALTWTDFYDRILEIREELAEPYFLWVFLLDSHQPYIAPSRYRTENTGLEMYYANVAYEYGHTAFEELPGYLEDRLEAAYRDTIRSVDGFVDRLLKDLDGDNPALVFHADHGEAMMEHATRGHRPELYDENLRVPLLGHNVGTTGWVSEQTALRHLPRLLSSIAAGEPDPAEILENPVVAKTEENERVAVRTAEWKRIDSDGAFEFARESPADELYHLPSDNDETQNLVNTHREIVTALDGWVAGHDRALDERYDIIRALRDSIQERTL
ncbi:arylsulfatase [Natronococcus pandeyae]|uniref:Arylsulfatase n=1 Tax=Natronococcus pandeyae TaxID=2055836 RepID=A0A8J8Q0T6_9EURY|nr:sulfatase-like hydrolase/transferase [Natronococcus pandeyae]TYL36418.1 arylsulfatase [Natronococcus pandeyae]